MRNASYASRVRHYEYELPLDNLHVRPRDHDALAGVEVGFQDADVGAGGDLLKLGRKGGDRGQHPEVRLADDPDRGTQVQVVAFRGLFGAARLPLGVRDDHLRADDARADLRRAVDGGELSL